MAAARSPRYLAPMDVTFEQAIGIAKDLQRNGRLEDARRIYDALLEAQPDHADALHFSGVLAHQQGRSEEAAERMGRSLRHEPDRADYHSNHGIVLDALGRTDEAIAAYRRAIALDAAHPNAHNNLAVLLAARGELDRAERALRAAIRIDPEHRDALTNLGGLLVRRGRTREAVLHLCRATVLDPTYAEARLVLVRAHVELGETDRAVEILEEWLREDPSDPVALHTLAAVTGREVPARASDGYVATVFDRFAASFEAKLAGLTYRAPEVLAHFVAEAGFRPANELEVLDAGCGTGLCGPHLAPYARRLTGVDLSPGMLARAERKELYHNLVCGELTAFLAAHPRTFDLIVSADTLVYFGALEEPIAAAAAALRPGGGFVFTLEHAVDASEGVPYRIEPHGRYAHAIDYVEALLAGAGLRATIRPVEVRMEAGRPVAGLAVAALAPADHA